MLYPSGPELQRAATEIYADLDFPEGVAVADIVARPFVALNMISTVDGKAIVEGRASRISSPIDHLLMRQIRSAVDCVLVGAGTVRAEGFEVRVGDEQAAARRRRGWPSHPLAAIVTATGDLPTQRKVFRPLAGDRPPLIITSQQALTSNPERFADLARIARVLVAGDSAAEPAAVLDVLFRVAGVRRLLLEGGPTLNQAFVAAGLVDELFLTIAPRIVGGRSKTIVEGADAPVLGLRGLELVSISQADSELYLRYRIRPGC